MLLPEEQCVVNWLYQYGALPKIQVMKMLDMPEEKAERLLYTLRRSLRITEVLDGTYIALDPLAKPDQRISRRSGYWRSSSISSMTPRTTMPQIIRPRSFS